MEILIVLSRNMKYDPGYFTIDVTSIYFEIWLLTNSLLNALD